MTKHAFSVYAYCKQKRCLLRHLVIKPRSMKLSSFISRLQEWIAYLPDFHPDTEGKETAPLPEDEIMDVIYHSIPPTWKNKMIEQGFNYAESTIKEISHFFGTRVENLEHPKNLLQLPRNSRTRNPHRKGNKKTLTTVFRVQRRIFCGV